MHGQAASLTVERFPIVRPSDPKGRPGVEWACLKPEQHPYGFWTVDCPTRCGGRTEVWEVDGTRFVLAPEPRCGCSSEEQARRMAASSGLSEDVFMPVYIVTKGLLDDVATMLSLPSVAAAYDGTLRFKSDHSRIQALDIRLREAGADDAVRALAAHVLRSRLAGGS